MTLQADLLRGLPKALRPFRFPRLPSRRLDDGVNRVKKAATAETLTGEVQGKNASDLEEMFARGLDKNDRVTGFDFDVTIATPYQLPGQENQVDFFVYVGSQVFPIELDGEIAHKSAEEQADDQERDQILSEFLTERGAFPIQRIPFWKIEDQDQVDRVITELF